jgi:hypothetical protein
LIVVSYVLAQKSSPSSRKTLPVVCVCVYGVRGNSFKASSA